MHREFLEYSPLHGRWTYLEFDPVDPDSCTIVDEFDMAHVQRVMDQNARLKHTGMKNEFGYIAASVPAAVKHIWKTEHGVDYDSQDPDMQKKIDRMMNDSDWRKLRIWEGKL